MHQVMVFALKEQNRIIAQLRREANANFTLLDDRSRHTQGLVQKLVSKVRSFNSVEDSEFWLYIRARSLSKISNAAWLEVQSLDLCGR